MALLTPFLKIKTTFSVFEFLMSNIQQLIDLPVSFARDSYQLVQKCTKPDRKGTGG